MEGFSKKVEYEWRCGKANRQAYLQILFSFPRKNLTAIAHVEPMNILKGVFDVSFDQGVTLISKTSDRVV